VVLMAKGTRDEAYYWISDRKEKSMNREIRSLSGQVSESLSREFSSRQLEVAEKRPEERLDSWAEGKNERREGGRIYVDPRERGMAKLLESRGLEVILKSLEVGDYVISDRVAIERKTAQDFVASIIDPERNLFRQIADLSRSYERGKGSVHPPGEPKLHSGRSGFSSSGLWCAHHPHRGPGGYGIAHPFARLQGEERGARAQAARP